ncbi:hypothetical protein VPHD520_0056 [Vibrio phage D520]
MPELECSQIGISLMYYRLRVELIAHIMTAQKRPPVNSLSL